MTRHLFLAVLCAVVTLLSGCSLFSLAGSAVSAVGTGVSTVAKVL